MTSDHGKQGAGDRKAYTALWEGAKSDVLTCVLRRIPYLTDAEEVVQETSVILWEKFDSFVRGTSFAAWACGVARNVARRWAAERGRWVSVDPVFFDRDDDPISSPHEDHRMDRLQDCLEKLPHDHSKVVRQYYAERINVQEIATLRDSSTDAVYKVLQRSLRRLLECIERTKGAD